MISRPRLAMQENHCVVLDRVMMKYAPRRLPSKGWFLTTC